MTNPEKVSDLLIPNKEDMRAHLDFMFKDMTEYSDCFIEIAYTPPDSRDVRMSERFAQGEIERAVEYAVKTNSVHGQNVYVISSLINPDVAPFGRAGDEDAYVAPCGWVDIDDGYSPEQLKGLYKELKPSIVVVTGRTPNIRTQMWFKYFEPIRDHDTIREVNEGLILAFKGDVKCPNPSRPMRLAGSVAWPKKPGRKAELTELKKIAGAKVSTPELLMGKYPAKDFIPEEPEAFTGATNTYHTETIGIVDKIADDRDKYMSDMLFVTIINLTEELGRWPTPEEVFADAWPVYEKKVTARGGNSLEQDGRGMRSMRQKIHSKIRLFSMGRMRRAPSFEEMLRRHKAKPEQGAPKAEGAGSADKERPKSSLSYVKFSQIQPSIEANDFVQGLLGQNQMSVTYGESNCGKTFFMTDLSFHVAMGREWRSKRVEGGGVIYAALEGSHGLKNRIAAFRNRNLITDDIPFAMVASQIDFLNPEGNIKEFIDLINRAADDLGSVKLVVIDTLARALMGGDENSGQDMGMIVKHADAIRFATGAHANFIHHSGKDKAKGARGHSSLRAAVDTEIEVSREDGADFSIVKVAKQREMEAGEDMAFRLETVSLGENRYGEGVSSCVVVAIEKEDNIVVAKDMRPLTGKQQTVYEAIVKALLNGQRLHPYYDGPELLCITYEQLRVALEAGGVRSLVAGENSKVSTEDKVKSYIQSGKEQLKKMGRIGASKSYLWIIE